MGTRGLPAAYGGFETFAQELSARLVARGHSVTVFQRHAVTDGLLGFDAEPLGGVQRRSTATVMHKYAETPLSSLSSFLDLFLGRVTRRREFDVALLCNAANSPFSFLAKLCRVPLAINVDGVERLRAKWNGAGKLWYRLGEQSSVWFADRIIADAKVIFDYYAERFAVSPAVITYGADPKPVASGETLSRFGVKAGRYLLYVSRFEPENNALGVVQGYVRSGVTDVPLVMVGDAPYADEYKAKVRAAAAGADERVIFTGFQFGEAYRELRSNCLGYIQATEVGGTHPALVEGMAYGNAIIANAVPEHLEVLGDTGLYYPKNDFDELATLIAKLVADAQLREQLGSAAARRAQQLFSWDSITDKYEELLLDLCNRSES
jgi:glycosyltransferase involved in cell wall biosynthesis